MRRKITRIFLRWSGVLFLSLCLLLLALYFGVQSYAFQTWLARQASSYLSAELGTEVRVEKVRLDLFTRASITELHILDKHGDTLFHGDIDADISGFDYRNQKLRLDKITLVAGTVKAIRYVGDSSFNYQFLIDYFDTGKKTEGESAWDVRLGEIRLNDVDLVYRRQKYAGNTAPQINFDDILLTGVYGSLDKIDIGKDTIRLSVHGLMAKERSGFELSRLDCRASISSSLLMAEDLYIKTPRTSVKGRVQFNHASWDDYSDFVNKVKMDAVIADSSVVSFHDIAAFTSELNGLEAYVHVSGEVKGYVSDMNVRNLKLQYGRDTRFTGNVSISGLPDFNRSYLHFDAKELTTSYTDIISLTAYPFHEKQRIKIPVMLSRLGTVNYKGKFDGFVNDFTTYGTFRTALGDLIARMSIQLGEKESDTKYHGKLSANGFDLGKLLGQNDFNGLVFAGEVSGRGLSVNTLDAELRGHISSLKYNRYNYHNITVNGSFSDRIFNGLLVSKDPNADFDFNGSINFNGKVPEMDFISTINHLRLQQLHFTTKADSGTLASQILINIRGDNIDNLTGQVHFDNTIYTTRTKQYKLSTLNIQADQAQAEKKINLSSAYLNAFVHGNFEITNLKAAFEQFLYTYYPTFFKKPVSQKKFTDEMDFRVIVKKFNTVSELFIPDLMLAPSTLIEGNFNAADNKFNMQMTSPKASYKSIAAEELVFILNESQHTVLAEASGKALHFSDSLSMDHFNFVVRSEDKDSWYTVDWDNLQPPRNKGEIGGRLFFGNDGFHLKNEKTILALHDTVWRQSAPAELYIGKDGSISVDSMFLHSHAQVISAKGRISEQPCDSMIIGVHNVILEQFNPILRMFRLKLEGVANGDITLSNVAKNFVFSGDLGLTALKINDNTVGELFVKTRYLAAEKKINLQGFTSLGIQDEFGVQAKNISFNGAYYPEKKDESIDVDFAATPANIRLLNPFLEGILTIKNGFVNGTGKVHGTPSNIMIDGKFRLYNSEVKVDYTNVTYIATGDIEVMPDQIRFSDVLLREKGSKSAPQGTLNGNIFHRNFDRMQLDYDITYRNMLVLNTTENENSTFYGKIYGTGNVGIYGYINDLHMQIVDTTTKNSKFVLPLDGPAEIGENDFIHFVRKDTVKTKKNQPLTGFSLEMKIHATPDAQAQILLDKQHGDMLNGQGYGDLILRINTLGNFEMFGEYIITSGDYLFTLENVINKKFDIESGSSIFWSGNPYNAEINVTATYKQRTSIAPLLNDTTAKGRFPVECKVLIGGKLFSPTINFAIDFPNIEPTAKARINNVLSDEAELNRQVAAFLLFRTFVTPQIFNAGGGGVTAGGAAASTGSELLSNRVSEFLNTYFGNLTGISDLQLGLNYRPGNQSNSEAVDLALSKQFFNNKVSVDGNFGVNSTQSRNSSGLIGDVNIDYKLSEDGRYRLKGFNRSNDITQVTTAGGPYTQGIGLFYREEFETFTQLLKRYQRKRRIPKTPPPDNASLDKSAASTPQSESR
jgi:hypothetical protein